MKTIPLGNTGLNVTKTAMGCLPVQRCDLEYGVRLLRAAYDGGIRYFDTANAYTDSEEKIGLALSDVRSNIVISTKSQDRTRDGVLKHIENSLKMMKTDYIDLFQFHNVPEMPDPDDPEGAYAGAVEAKSRGWIHHIGFTSHRVNVAEQCIDSGLFETCQFPFSYISSDRDLALADRCKKAGMGYIAMKGLAGGLLTNAKACHAFMNCYDNVVPIWGIQKFEELEQWLRLAEEDPVMDEELNAVIKADRQQLAGGLLTNAKACHAFMNCYDNVVPIWGIQKFEELEQWLRLAEEDPVMDEEISEFIKKERQDLSGTFCRSCGYCMPCTVGIEIRNCARMNMLLRRSPWQQYMTDEWYERMQKINDCIGCGKCASRCPYQLDTPNLLKYMLKDYNEFYEEHKKLM